MSSTAVVIGALRFYLYHSLGKFSRWQTDDNFSRKQNFTFHANCLHYLHEILNRVSYKKAEKYFKTPSAEIFTQSAKRY